MSVGEISAQQRKHGPPPRFKRNKKMARICPIFVPSEYPYQGIGAKIGDPFALTYKLYATEYLAFSIDGGSAASGLYNDFHRDNFTTYPEFDTVTYDGHNVERELVIQARIMFHNQVLHKIIPGLDWYLGVGWQFRDLEIKYFLLYEPTPNFRENLTADQNVFSQGPEGIIGIEYAYFDIPISAFAEVNLFKNIDFSNAPLRLQGGIGLRYVF